MSTQTTTVGPRTTALTGTVLVRRTLWLVIAVGLIVLTVRSTGSGGWTVAAAIIGGVLPDLAFFVGVGQRHARGSLPRAAVGVYNTLHRVWLPSALLTVCLLASRSASELAAAGSSLGIAWLAHIALDRGFGYGLRNADGSLR